jgi:hypothetical protein
VAFAVVGACSALSVLWMWRLPADAGHEMAGKARPGGELAEPKVAQRPAT